MWGLEACPPRWSPVHPFMGNGMSRARLLSICGTYSPGGFEPVSAAFRNGGGDAGSPVGSNHLKLVLMWAHVPLLLMRSVQLMSFLLLSC